MQAQQAAHGGAHGSVTVRYWAAARAAAGRELDHVTAGTLAEVLAEARSLHTDSSRFSAVVSVCSVLVGADPVGDRDHHRVVVPPGAVVELLPPFAGG